MKVLLVSLKADETVNLAPPIGLYQLQGYLAGEDIACDLLDREMEDYRPYVDAVGRGEYQVVGLSVSRVHMKMDLDLLWQFRRAAADNGHACVFLAGGPEATINWRQWLESGVDVIFTGFAEVALTTFCRKIADSGLPPPPAKADLDALCGDIDGIAFMGQGGQTYRPSPPLTVEIFRELFHRRVRTLDPPIKAYWDRLRELSANTDLGAARFVIENVRIYTSSHCPRGCGFCNSQSFLPLSQGKPSAIIMLTAEEVMDLMLHYVDRYGARSFLMSDDDFPIGNAQGILRLDTLCRLVIEHKRTGRIPPDLQISCQARILDFVIRAGDGPRHPNRELLALMKQAGFASIGLGVETFSDRLLKAPSVNKVACTAADVRAVLDTMLDLGLAPQTNLILGIPEYTLAELAETVETAFHYITRGCDVSTIRKMLALPGAPAFESGRYPYTTEQWANPYSGRTIDIAGHFIPEDPAVAGLIARFGDLYQMELDRVIERYGWQGKLLHKRVVNICNLMGVARGIGRDDLADRFNAFLEATVQRTEAAQ